MKTRAKKIAYASIGVAVAIVGYRWLSAPAAESPLDPALVADRVWVEAEPESLRQLVHRAFLVSSVRLGIFDHSSFYAGRHEIFEWKRAGDRLRMVFPQDRRKAEIQFAVTRCDDLFPYDLCLDLRENPWGGPQRFYGMEDPDDGTDEAKRTRARLRAILPGARP